MMGNGNHSENGAMEEFWSLLQSDDTFPNEERTCHSGTANLELKWELLLEIT